MNTFYRHLIEIESLIVKLDEMNLTVKQKAELAHLVDSNIHQSILDAILSELSGNDKRAFITYLTNNNHDQIWLFLNDRIDNIEQKIKKTVDDLAAELHKDLKEAKVGRL